MTKHERNLATARRYIELYNSDIQRFVTECYTSDCQVICSGIGAIEGHVQFLNVERTVLKAAPRRRMRVEHEHVLDDGRVAMEITLLDPDQGDDWELPFITILTMRDSLIAIDMNYADWSRWPGLHL